MEGYLVLHLTFVYIINFGYRDAKERLDKEGGCHAPGSMLFSCVALLMVLTFHHSLLHCLSESFVLYSEFYRFLFPVLIS